MGKAIKLEPNEKERGRKPRHKKNFGEPKKIGMNNSKSESAIGSSVFYSKVKKELNSVIPDYVKAVLVDLRDQPQAALWIEIGKALNSFPISEKVDKFRLMEVKELKDFRYANKVSDLVFDA